MLNPVQHHSTNGLKLSRRGMMVVIIEKRDKNWYSAREPDIFGSGVVPCHFVHIVKFVCNCCLSDLLLLISGHLDT
jgi:hypothetical protein